MPELPEVETMVRGIRPTVEGRTIVAADPCRCPCKPLSIEPDWPRLRELAVGQPVVRVWRRAKRVILSLANGAAFAIEPRMTGLMLVTDPPDPEHLRMRWSLDSGDELHFWDRRGLGTIRLYEPHTMEAMLAKKLGPDALEITAEQWRHGLGRTRREVKVAMLDQKLVAGIGNLYASEILHRCRIDPRAVAAAIGPKRIARLHEATQEVLNEAIRYEGSTLGDGTYRNALNQDGSYQNAHRVYARAGEPCVECGRPIRRIVQAQRSTFFCATCQRK